MTETTLPMNSGARKGYPLYRGLLRYFPAALAEVSRIAQIGNDKHGDGGTELYHYRGRSADHADCIIRHMIDMSEDYGSGTGYDENGVPQVVYVAWRALAMAQEWLETNEARPLAPAALED